MKEIQNDILIEVKTGKKKKLFISLKFGKRFYFTVVGAFVYI